MRIAPEGWPFIAAAAVLELLLLAAWLIWRGASVVAPGAALVLLGWVVAFFRDPVRVAPRGDHLLLSPADGLVVGVAEFEEPMYLHAAATRVSIFMSVFNVHVNRYPASGTIELVHRHSGAFTVASREKASLLNEQNSVGILSPRGRVLVRQIAGVLARRIVTDGVPGRQVTQGERMGMIRFGSRVDLLVPRGVTIRVQQGDRVTAGRSVLAEWAP